MVRIAKLGVLIASVFALAACGGKEASSPQGNLVTDSTQPPAEQSSVEGNWSGTWTSETHLGSAGTFTMDFTLSGDALEGPIEIAGSECLSAGTITGTLAGSQIQFGAVEGAQSVSYEGTVQGDHMSGTYSALSCDNGAGSWEATRTA